MRQLRIGCIALLGVIASIMFAAGASATVIGLPADGSQVNNDPASGIDPNQNAGASDVVGGSLALNGPRVPWGTFEQQSGSSQQIFASRFCAAAGPGCATANTWVPEPWSRPQPARTSTAVWPRA